MTAALVVLLGLSAPLRAPDLQVEAATTGGVELPELADAVARALVASGARVVLRGPSSGPCPYCAKVAVIETGQGNCRVEVNQERHTASAKLQFPAGSPLFDRARAIAIQARLLVTWETHPDARTKDAVARSSLRRSDKPERKSSVEHVVPELPLASAAPLPSKETETVPSRQPEAVPPQVTKPPVVSERRGDAPALHADRTGAKTAERAETEKPKLAQSQPVLAEEVASAGLGPRRKQWPWIPTVLGSGAAVAAGICAVVARERYDALSDKSQPYQTAVELKAAGQNWQLASIVLSGVAVVGLTTGLIGFITRSSERPAIAASALPMPGGGMIAVAGDLP